MGLVMDELRLLGIPFKYKGILQFFKIACRVKTLFPCLPELHDAHLAGVFNHTA